MVGIMVGIMQLPLIIPCNFGTMNLSYRAAALAPPNKRAVVVPGRMQHAMTIPGQKDKKKGGAWGKELALAVAKHVAS